MDTDADGSEKNAEKQNENKDNVKNYKVIF